ncbi:MAG: 4-phosphopantoate--beta-alanine ligase [Acidobacteria bacterium]|nr:4-phosphopantoate--beta-alanine ligase [Acidobacteriota bacterium]
MEIVNRVSRMCAISAKLVASEVRLGLVSTMGSIHPGHVSLIQSARSMADLVLVSIFVNRLQFRSEEEYLKYPRDIMKDIDSLSQEKVDYVFTPHEEELFPPGFATYVQVEGMESRVPALQDKILVRGMATNMLKLLHIIRPSFVFLGQKDAIHGMVLRKMIRDFNLGTEIVVSPVVREAGGMAHGVRNLFLTEKQRAAAGVIYRSLMAAEKSIRSGELSVKKVSQEAADVVESEPLAVLEYVLILNPETLEPVARITESVLIAVGARLGGISLNDSIRVEKATKG